MLFNNHGDSAKAHSLISESLVLQLELGDKLGIAENIVRLIEINSLKNFSALSTKLLGSVEATLEAVGVILERGELTSYERAIFALREQLSMEKFSECFAEGKTLTIEQAVELALLLNSDFPPVN
jgi:hypothetical protein